MMNALYDEPSPQLHTLGFENDNMMEMPGFQMNLLLFIVYQTLQPEVSRSIVLPALCLRWTSLPVSMPGTYMSWQGVWTPGNPTVSSLYRRLCDGEHTAIAPDYVTKRATSLWNQDRARSWHTLQAETSKRNVPDLYILSPSSNL